MTSLTHSFTPDWVSPPGDTILDLLEERDWTQTQLSERLGYTTKHISQLINGKATINEETALKLERVLGSTAGFWLNREAQYRAQLAKIEEQERLKTWTPWLDELPVKELMQQGVIPKRRIDAKSKPGIVRELLHFFGVASPDEWQAFYVGMECAFRQTQEAQSDVGAITAWIRQGEILGVPSRLEGKLRRCYVMWKEKVPPLIVIEFVSGDGEKELAKALAIQEREKKEKLAAYLRSLGINPDEI